MGCPKYVVFCTLIELPVAFWDFGGVRPLDRRICIVVQGVKHFTCGSCAKWSKEG